MKKERLDSFYGKKSPEELATVYGTPVYIYNENILRQRCREMAGLVKQVPVKVNYSTKANSNLELLKIIRSEGLDADAMSPGEIVLLLAAGFQPSQIVFIGNNVSDEEFQFAVEHQVKVSVDSIAQLKRLGRINPGGEVIVRFNPGVGTGHHEKVVTGGDKTKFGVSPENIAEVKEVLSQYGLRLYGINQHIGSFFLESSTYLEGAARLLAIAEAFPELTMIDFGGGFGIPYHKDEAEGRLDLEELGGRLGVILSDWCERQKRQPEFRIEPGRYVVAECGRLLGTVHALKDNREIHFIGTDLGFNVLARPILYGAHHDLHLFRKDKPVKGGVKRAATVVGNICETGDKLTEGYLLPEAEEGDRIEVMDAGAYGFAMSSNYNCRLRPAEVLIDASGNDRLIRRRETFEDLLRGFVQ